MKEKVLRVNWVVFLMAITCVASLGFGASLTGPEPPDLIPRQVLFGNPVRENPILSPEGSRLCYLAPSKEGVMNIWVRTVGKDDDSQVTCDSDQGIEKCYWAPGGQHILYLQDSDGDENDHVYCVDLNSRNIRDLTPFQGVKAVNLIMTAEDLLVGLNLRNRQLFDIYRVNIDTGEMVLDTKNPGDVVYMLGREWIADTQGVIRAVKAMDLKTGGTILRVRDRENSPWRELKRWPMGALFDGYITGFSENGRSLFVTSSDESDKTRLVEMDVASGEVLRTVAQDQRCDIIAEVIITHPESGFIQAYETDFMKPEWHVLDNSIAADFAKLKAYRKGHFSILSRNQSDTKWTVGYLTDNGPRFFYLFDRPSGQIQFLFSDKPELEKYQLARMKPVIITARDGLELVSYLTRPVGIKDESTPLILFVHGGPTAKDTWGYDPIVQMLANRGYSVLQVNFRGSVGFGKEFQTAGNLAMGIGAMQHDLTDAVLWAVKQGYADPDKVGIFGGSYGGYATLAGLTFTPQLYACGAEICGPSNLKTFMEAIPPYWGPMKAMLMKIFGDPENDPEYNRNISPFYHVDHIRVPLLIGQGANDPRCKIGESDQIVAAMREKKLPVTYIVYADEGHGFVRPENLIDFYGRLDVFFGRNLGGRFEPFHEIPGSSAEVR